MAQCWHMALWLLETCGNCGEWRAQSGQEASEADPGVSPEAPLLPPEAVTTAWTPASPGRSDGSRMQLADDGERRENGQYADLRDGLVRGQRAHGVNTAERMDLAARSRGHEEGIELKPKPSNPLLGQSLNARLVSIHPGFRGGIAPR